MQKKMIIANWKMNPTLEKEAENLFNAVAKNLPVLKKTEIIICPPSIFFSELLKIRTTKIKLGAQNSFWGEKGAFTGEVSAEMLSNLGVQYVILGHSERRSPSVGGGETNEVINKKIKGALSAGLVPILCVGDKERDTNHEYFNLIKTQVEEGLNGISKELISKVIIAYEPVWALSTTTGRKDATPADSYEMNIFIRKILTDKFGVKTKMPKIIYGGSVNEKNILGFLTNGGIDGVLVGGASLNPEKFLEIIKIAESVF